MISYLVVEGVVVLLVVPVLEVVVDFFVIFFLAGTFFTGFLSVFFTVLVLSWAGVFWNGEPDEKSIINTREAKNIMNFFMFLELNIGTSNLPKVNTIL
jgi:hypothetical protein